MHLDTDTEKYSASLKCLLLLLLLLLLFCKVKEARFVAVVILTTVFVDSDY